MSFHKRQDVSLVLALILIFSGIFYIVEESSEFGKDPNDTVVTFKKERNLVTGELMNVEIVRCKVCGEVISYIEYNYLGKAVGGYVHEHHCGYKWGQAVKKPNESSFGPHRFNFLQWLDAMQERYKLKH